VTTGTARTSRKLHKQLRRIVGPEHVLTSPADRRLYAYDASLESGQPDAVVLPADAQQVADVVRLAAAEGIPFLPRGAGTNLSGGSVPIQGGIVIGLSRLNRILQIDEADGYAIVEPGVVNQHLQNVLAERGCFYAPDPASQKVATLGGNVGENSGGPHCLKYGVTTNHVLGLEVVTPEGDVCRLGHPTAASDGYDLTGLFVGAEGTFGIVTRITARVLPMPESVRTMLAVYDNLDAAARSVSGIIASGIVPATLEMIDQPVIHAIEESLACGYPMDAEAVLIIELDGMAEEVEAATGQVVALCREYNVRQIQTAQTAQERDNLWAGRRGAFGAIARIAPNYLVMDGTVPRTALTDVLRQTREVADRYGLKSGNVFHAGDGNLHPLLLFDPREPGAEEKVRQAGHEILRICAEAGGTITGEHGIGLEKLADMDQVFSASDMGVMKAIKMAFDPAGLCNPGKVIPADVTVTEPPVGDKHPTPQPAGEDRAVDGLQPRFVVRPTDEADLTEALIWCRQEQLAAIPWAGGTHVHLGNRPARYDVALVLDGLPQRIDHDVDNLTLTVSANVPLAEVQTVLREKGQFLPLEAAGNKSTVGGLIAAATCGPRSSVYGRPRDLVLGMRAVLGSGELVCPGGRTLKNVAGYDLCRPLVGSLGTLGVMTELVFRLLPSPAATKVLRHRCETIHAADGLARQIRESGLPVSAMVFSSASLTVGVQGVPEAVSRMERELDRLAGGRTDTLEGGQAEAFWSSLLPECLADECRVIVSSPRTQLLPIAARATEVLPESTLLCDMLSGRTIVTWPGNLAGVSALAESAAGVGGCLLVEAAPPEVKEGLDVWMPTPDGVDLTRRLKRVCDPGNVLSPGRMASRI